MATAILSLVIERKYITQMEFASLVVLTIGVMIAVWEGAMAGSVYGIILCLAGMVSNAAMMSMSSKVLSEKVDAFRWGRPCSHARSSHDVWHGHMVRTCKVMPPLCYAE